MNQKIKAKEITTTIGIYLLWIAVMVVWVFALFQLQSTLLTLATFVIDTPSLRPAGWNTETLKGVERCGLFIMGSLWLGISMYSLRHLREAANEQRLWISAAWLILIAGALIGLGIGIFYLIG